MIESSVSLRPVGAVGDTPKENERARKESSRKQESLFADDRDKNGPQSNYPDPDDPSAGAKEDTGGFVLVILEERDSRRADLAFFAATWPVLAKVKE